MVFKMSLCVRPGPATDPVYCVVLCCVTVVFELLALSIWGAQFHQHLQHSVTDPVCRVTVVFELLALSIWGA